MTANPFLSASGGLLLSLSTCSVIATEVARELRSKGVLDAVLSVELDLPDNPDVLLKAEQVSGLMAISRDAVFDLARRQHNPLPSRKIGRSRRFVRAEVDAWIARQD